MVDVVANPKPSDGYFLDSVSTFVVIGTECYYRECRSIFLQSNSAGFIAVLSTLSEKQLMFTPVLNQR